MGVPNHREYQITLTLWLKQPKATMVLQHITPVLDVLSMLQPEYTHVHASNYTGHCNKYQSTTKSLFPILQVRSEQYVPFDYYYEVYVGQFETTLILILREFKNILPGGNESNLFTAELDIRRKLTRPEHLYSSLCSSILAYTCSLENALTVPKNHSKRNEELQPLQYHYPVH